MRHDPDSTASKVFVSAAELHCFLGTVSSEKEDEVEALTSRCNGLRAALQAQEKHAEALDRELQTRPTAAQVGPLFLTLLFPTSFHSCAEYQIPFHPKTVFDSSQLHTQECQT